ncbi:hypothetical protein SAMN05192553_102677 [Cyclobacterium xiamenense]|uniref:Uncharacterized protein n=1 Tax=Cyclobacterium xiamenense TaxID=1297121 RepID=A0A1H6WG26_9BACT|nr:hypothetical protein [Cyclobacterium xiamenense]SEJ15833.1 hypothetical protein SAMN05192553_102677 [Cyclobacterium xiamenense]
MSETQSIRKVGKSRVATTDAGAFVMGNNPFAYFDEYAGLSRTVDWEADPALIGGVKLVPHGLNNDLPVIIRDIMDKNNLAPGILEREMGLLYGDGPQLYQVKYEGGKVSREYVEDGPVQAWLDSWDYKRYIDMAMVEYKYMKGVYVKRVRNRAPRIGGPGMIKYLEVVPGTDARLEWPEQGPKRLESVKRIWVGDFQNHCLHTGMIGYPVHDPWNPFKHGISIAYHNKYSFGRNFYSVPSYYGSLNWIMRSSDIPEVLKYLSENGITSAYHIHSPAGYWEAKEEKIEKMHPGETEAQRDKRLEELKDKTFQKMAQVLTGKRNAGKFIETVDFYDEDGNKNEWKVEAIDQKIKDFVESQVKIGEKADSATTSGMGLHPSLSNIIVNGQLSSGSQMLYALKLYMASDTTLPEEVIFEPINQAIAANFPGRKLRMGFYHHSVMKEEDVVPNERLVNNAENPA